MSDNPFDVFAADFKAAIPSTDGSDKTNQPINIMAQPAPAPVPVMNAPAAPVMNQPPQPQQSMNGAQMGMMNQQSMYGGGFGMNGNSMTAPAPQGGMSMGGSVPPPAMTGSQPNPMGGGMPGAMVPSTQQSNPYAMNMNYGQPAQPQMGQMAPSPYGVAPSPYGAPPVSETPNTTPAPPRPDTAVPVSSDPFSPVPPSQPGQAPPVPPAFNFTLLQESAPVPNAAPPVPPAGNDPFGGPAPVPTAGNDPFGGPAPVPTAGNDTFGGGDPFAPPSTSAAIVPVPNEAPAGGDPFLVFDTDAHSTATPAPQNNYTAEQVAAAADDPWNSTFGNGTTNPPSNNMQETAPPTNGGSLLGDDAIVPVAGEKHKSGELPPGGEWYDARIFTPTLGVMFFKPQELTDSLFLQTDKNLVEALEDRPVVAFIVEGSSARAAGVELGHVLLKVNGIDVKNPKEASRLIKEGPRPLPLLFYVPDTTVVVAEGEHMVKYDTRDTTAPNSAKDWKPKYVVIGGIIAQPWMINMYRSKSEYDIAVIETQARRPVTVKVKQFSLQGARIQNDWQGPQMVKYKNKLHPWKYIVILPISRNPIKISSPNLAQLKPVHEGIRRVLMAQNRFGPNNYSAGGDSYAGQQQGGYNGQQQGGYNGQQQGGYNGQQQYAGNGNYSQPPGQYDGQYNGAPDQQSGYGGYNSNQYSTAGGTGSVRRRTEY